MKAAVLYEANQPLVIEDINARKPGPREVLLNTAYAGFAIRTCISSRGFIRTRCRSCWAMNRPGSSIRSARK